MKHEVDAIFNHFKSGNCNKYFEEKHCKMLISIMMNPDKGSVPAFCVQAMITERTFYNWVRANPIFSNLYYFSKLIAREIWEQEGRNIRDQSFPMGTINYSFEHWKLIGYSKFGVSKNGKIKLDLVPEDSPAQHYAQLLRQAAEGDFTASEIKQLMEAVNVGLNTHQVFELQKQINELQSDLSIMNVNQDGHNTSTNKGIAQKD